MSGNLWTLRHFFSSSASSDNASQHAAPPPRGVIFRQTRRAAVALGLPLLLAVLGVGGCGGGDNSSPAQSKNPNIVLIVVDDIGIDQWQVFGYGGPLPPSTPNIDVLANQGVRFHNMWSMPACSNGRAALYTGRYPFRTRVFTALGNNDLANYMVNPNEATMPKLLQARGYATALFGKFHMGIQENNPYDLGMVHAFGFDYYDGWLDETGDPSSIDTTAGGVSPLGTWSCGFVRDAANGGADTGACYAADGTCSPMAKSGVEAPGRVCRDGGGIFDPNNSCASPVPDYINFANLSAHYVSPVVIDDGTNPPDALSPTDPRSRTYRGIEPVDAALSWIARQPKHQPWLVALSFATAHTPIMQPPSQLLPAGEPDTSNLDCTSLADQRIMSDQMTEAMDFEVGRFLVGAGLAKFGKNGALIYNPKASNTYIIFVNDNGSTGSVAKPPFDPTRAKSTAYQTGVWVPGIVAGPGVKNPGRSIDAMVNIVDVFQLVGELAGIDVHATIDHPVDSVSMLPYLRNPNQAEIRPSNFTQIGTNEHANGQINGPCQYNSTTCTQIAPSQGVCEDNNGIWWGAGATDPSTAGIPPEGLQFCCDVAVWQHDHGQTVLTDIYPLEAHAIRNDNYKIVVNNYNGYDADTNACKQTTSEEFYQINEDVPTPLLDEEDKDLLATGMPPLTADQQKNLDELSAELDALMPTQSACLGDINLDGVVNQADIDQWTMLQALSPDSTWADMNQDGVTNSEDMTIIEQQFGACP